MKEYIWRTSPNSWENARYLDDPKGHGPKGGLMIRMSDEGQKIVGERGMIRVRRLGGNDPAGDGDWVIEMCCGVGQYQDNLSIGFSNPDPWIAFQTPTGEAMRFDREGAMKLVEMFQYEPIESQADKCRTGLKAYKD
tara:strand:+ start:444 stop:854 length:411 start_codon:yes stop_codon:yes gene_type:complete